MRCAPTARSRGTADCAAPRSLVPPHRSAASLTAVPTSAPDTSLTAVHCETASAHAMSEH